VVLLDEAAYIDESVIQNILTPVLQLSNSCLVAISTLGKSPTNTFTKMLNCGAFEVYKVTYICDACQARGQTSVCKHKRHVIPPHLNTEDGVGGKIFGEDDESVLRETMGLIREEASSYCFSHWSLILGKTTSTWLLTLVRDRIVRITRLTLLW
jgi:hypothetical protein